MCQVSGPPGATSSGPSSTGVHRRGENLEEPGRVFCEMCVFAALTLRSPGTPTPHFVSLMFNKHRQNCGKLNYSELGDL